MSLSPQAAGRTITTNRCDPPFQEENFSTHASARRGRGLPGHMHILISSLPGDGHAHAIEWGLKQKGHTVSRLYPLDLCDGAQWSFSPGDRVLKIKHRGIRSTLELDSVDAVWNRRVPVIYPLNNISRLDERAAAETEMASMALGVIGALEDSAFAVNKLDAAFHAERKATQLVAARSVGFPLPKTSITNDRHAIRDLHEETAGDMIYKPLVPFFWSNESTMGMPTTTQVDDLCMLDNLDVQASPSIFQEHARRKADVRVTIMGESQFSWALCPKSDRRDVGPDWRFLGKRHTEYALHELPGDVASRCLRLTQRLGLIYASIDLALHDDGSYQFFEINQGGQFLWGDELDIGLPQFDAFQELLLTREATFRYRPQAFGKTYQDYLHEVDIETDFEFETSQHFGRFGQQHGRVAVKFL
jgi:hypothetical protein